ncbi:hypothetical protein A4H97_25610 [Niastella yeongjuensis]|uniref:Uncharacterized protein n=1 Tax=Niastella yeongjuensis TaxID=354355 RepID=A0A1V9F0X3_9BACT|nr:hypothetical protein A4H97_25610 [Niastella yeongjuensis]
MVVMYVIPLVLHRQDSQKIVLVDKIHEVGGMKQEERRTLTFRAFLFPASYLLFQPHSQTRAIL